MLKLDFSHLIQSFAGNLELDKSQLLKFASLIERKSHRVKSAFLNVLWLKYATPKLTYSMNSVLLKLALWKLELIKTAPLRGCFKSGELL